MSRLPSPDDPRWLLKTVFSRWRWTGPAAVLMTVGFLMNGLTPVIIGRAIDEAIAPGDGQRLLLWMGVLVGTFGTNIVLTYWGRRLMQRAILEVGHDLRMAVTDRVQDPKGLGGNKRTAGELLSIASADIQRVADAVFMTVFPFAEVASIVYVGVVLLGIHVPLGVAVLIGGPTVVWIALRASTPLRTASGRRQRSLATASGMATDVVQGLRIIKGLGAADTVRTRYGRLSDEAYHRTIGANAAQARLNAVTESVGAVYVIAVAVLSGFLTVRGTMSVGELITAIGLTQFIIFPMTMLGRNFANRWAPAQASGERIRSVLTAPARFSEEAETMPPTPAGLTVITAEAPDDVVLCSRDRVVVAPHGAHLFEGTVAENVHPDPARAGAALTVASADDIPGGPGREVGENGRNLSGGQRQRVALARAVASDAEVLILQDPTTAVDSVTEQRIARRVAEARAGRPTIVFTDAPAWKAQAQRVWDTVQEVAR
ncbi:ABC transporter transmembrane domain-containing protein [Corynebacterium guangdongense]|uniref:ABC-type multidrug transport system fused ATPase/permease subunit n=1 Tax=Corynebacterium guangdongense TaxID=1783348 RepID=A0ABU1ZWH3_9CORY|nr:ABC transporter ATP-binding protein [Corynebacterium guangdongense]MDR7329288.1 ABC-type multidrug transport system fused ATPase/permease subunit [Corynebacterium guangdongense]WJZ17854.1 putative multidrug resistance ABC transporter ATP-binding/permease protein YheI [Corynebacterium guangdongense]